MCANYRPVTASDRLLSYFGVVRREGDLPFEFQAEAFPTGFAPFIRRRQDGPDGKEVAGGHFGLLPHFAKELAYGRRTYNARSETVDQLASFKRAWARSQRCVVPVECVFEPNYESGKVVRWRIEQPGQVPIGIAGIWTEHPFMQDEHGQPLLSFSMPTGMWCSAACTSRATRSACRCFSIRLSTTGGCSARPTRHGPSSGSGLAPLTHILLRCPLANLPRPQLRRMSRPRVPAMRRRAASSERGSASQGHATSGMPIPRR